MWICDFLNLVFLGVVAFVTLANYIDDKKKNKRRPHDRD